jgi:hypothetical protein
LLESLCVIEHGLRTSQMKRGRGKKAKKVNMDARYASLRYQLVPHQVASTSILGTALSTSEHVNQVQTLFREGMASSIRSSSSSSSSSSSTSNSTVTTPAPVALTPSLIYRVHCEADDARFEPFDRLPSKHQMWYGIRKCELGGVLSHGIPFPSAEAPSSSYPYGKCLQLSTSPLVAAQRCFDFEPLVAKDEEDEDANTIVLGLCTVACGNMHTITRPAIYSRPPMPCHSIKLNHDQGQDIFIYDLGQIHLDSIVFVDAVSSEQKTTATGETAVDLVNDILAEQGNQAVSLETAALIETAALVEAEASANTTTTNGNAIEDVEMKLNAVELLEKEEEEEEEEEEEPQQVQKGDAEHQRVQESNPLAARPLSETTFSSGSSSLDVANAILKEAAAAAAKSGESLASP